jgi:hypothetical protein
MGITPLSFHPRWGVRVGCWHFPQNQPLYQRQNLTSGGLAKAETLKKQAEGIIKMQYECPRCHLVVPNLETHWCLAATRGRKIDIGLFPGNVVMIELDRFVPHHLRLGTHLPKPTPSPAWGPQSPSNNFPPHQETLQRPTSASGTSLLSPPSPSPGVATQCTPGVWFLTNF